MAKVNLGCCGASIRFLLVILNCLFLILGIVVFSTAAVLKWSTLFNKFINIEGIDTLIKAGSISVVSTILLVIGGFAIVLSLFGLCGVKYLSRFLLICYEIVIVLLFLVHGISILVLVFSSSSIEGKFKDAFAETIKELNQNTTSDKVFKEKCALSFSISEIFECCGAQGPADFFNTTISAQCCKNNNFENGCNEKVVNSIEKNAVNLLIIPSSIILAVELFGIIMVPFLIGRAGKQNQNSY